MTVRSILSQRIGGIEILIVNDNRAQFAPRNFEPFGFGPDVRILHHDANAGLSVARNTGLSAARGNLVGFLDADDYFMSDGLSAQLSLAEQSGADITYANCMVSQFGTSALRPLRREELLFHRQQQANGLGDFEAAQFFTSSWSSLYRRDFLDRRNLRFDPEQTKFEDRLFVLQTVTAAQSIASLGAPVRVWRRRAGSISVSPPNPQIHDLQLGLLEKCTQHMRAYTDQTGVPERFFEREIFNTASRLLWDLTVIETAAGCGDPAYGDYGRRIKNMLADTNLRMRIFDDPVVRHISRTGLRTSKGILRRQDFLVAYRALRKGDLADAAGLVAARRPAPPKHRKPPKPNQCHVILHLGMHKTGSTYLQRALFSRAAALRDAGVLVPVSGLTGPEFVPTRARAFAGHLGLVHALQTGQSAVWKALEEEVANSGCHTVLLSCEGMLMPLEPNREQLLGQLFDRLSCFKTCQPVAFVRRPDRAPEMLYREVVCNGQRQGARTAAEFMVDFAPILTDLPQLFDPFEKFSGRKTRLADYDAAVAQGGLVPAFGKIAQIAALGHCRATDTAPEDAAEYATPPREQVLAARVINTMIGPGDLRQRTLRSFFADAPSGGDDDPLLSPADRLTLVDRFIRASAEFAAARGYAPSFKAMRAEIYTSDRVSPSGLTSTVLERLLQARLFSELDADAHGNPTDAPRDTGTVILRLRPRPWLRRALGWIGSHPH